jgi:predicted nucleic acid-binding protein
MDTNVIVYSIDSADPENRRAPARRWIRGRRGTSCSRPAPIVLGAIAGGRAWGISFWDALIIRAAEASDCARVLSEDFANGAQYGSVTVENPFVGARR